LKYAIVGVVYKLTLLVRVVSWWDGVDGFEVRERERENVYTNGGILAAGEVSNMSPGALEG
jgi:hypothetical protein